MNLQTHIQPELWEAIFNSYNAGNYAHSISDAMHYVSNVLRDKAGVDGDGANLVGQALGGESPRLKVIRLETETERNVQKGLIQLLNGLYLAVRNPRSHEQIEDSQETADAIIYFVDYILTILQQSKERFTIEQFLQRVFDPDFVESKRYAEILASEIPTHKHLDTLIHIYRDKLKGNGLKLKYVVEAILGKLSESQTTDFLAIVSSELNDTRNDTVIRSVLQILPPNLWPQLDESARLRIETKLIGYIASAEEYLDEGYSPHGPMATWARRFTPYFTLQEELTKTLLKKLEDDDADDRRFVVDHFASMFPYVVSSSYLIQRFVQAITRRIDENDLEMIAYFKSNRYTFPDEWKVQFEKHEPNYFVEYIENSEDLPF